MTSSINLKKIISVGAAALLAIGGVLGAGIPANAAAATSAPVINGSALTGGTVSVTQAVWASGSATGKWYVCDNTSATTAATSVPAGCEQLYTANGNSAAITTTTLTVPSIAYCANMCTPFGNNSTSYKLRWIEVNNTDISASAAVAIREGRTLSLQNPSSGATSVVLGVSSGCTFAASTLSSFADWTLLVGGVAKTISSVDTVSGNITLNFSGAVTSSQSISVNYVKSSDPEITCGSTAVVKSMSSALTGTVSGGGGSSYTITSPASYSITNGVATANDGTWTGGTTTRFWILCNNPHNSPSNSIHMDCFPMALTQNGSDERGTTVTLANDVWMGFSGTRTQVAFSSKYFGLYVQNGGTQYVTATTAGAPVASVSAPVLTPEQARNQIKPLPVIVQPLVAAIPVLNKPMVNAGGKLDLSAGDFSGLVSASISGKPLDLTLGAKGGLTITVPNGEAGKTADLFLKFTSGTVIIQDAIKYVAPLVVADVPTRAVSIAAGSTKLSQATADQVRQAAFANMKNTTVSCVAYAANGSAAARAAAQASAEQVCALATKANPDLTATPVTVVVDKAKAKTEAVGIKVYKN